MEKPKVDEQVVRDVEELMEMAREDGWEDVEPGDVLVLAWLRRGKRRRGEPIL